MVVAGLVVDSVDVVLAVVDVVVGLVLDVLVAVLVVAFVVVVELLVVVDGVVVETVDVVELLEPLSSDATTASATPSPITAAIRSTTVPWPRRSSHGGAVGRPCASSGRRASAAV